MIHNQDRSGWFGASDTQQIMGPWTSKTFEAWWLEKLGVPRQRFQTVYTLAGNYFEHRILDSIGITQWDGQVKIRRLRLRVNLDGEDDGTVYEVKTHKGEYRLPRAHWMQCQVEMFATRKSCELVDYRMEAEDYENFFRPIDPARLGRRTVAYDALWIEEAYLPRLHYLSTCLRRKVMPVDQPQI